jgi:hypothetical protein
MAKQKIKRSNGIPYKEETAVGNYAEYSIARRTDKHARLQRLGYIGIYLAVVAVFVYLFAVLTPLFPIIGLSAIIDYILFLATWHRSKVEFTYIVEKGNFHIYRICGRCKAKEVLNVKLENNLGIYPANDEDYKEALDECEVKLDYCEAIDAEDVYFAIFNIDGKKTAVYFSAATKLLTTMRYFGGENVIVTYVSH